DQLAGQVEQLRTEQDQLRSQADELGIQNDQLASFITEIGPDLVADTLPGNDIAILTDDSSTRPATERTSELLEEAGAQSVTRVDLQPALWEPDEDDRRTEAISAISAIAPGAPDTELEGSEQLSAVIVTLLAPAAADSDLDPELTAPIAQLLACHLVSRRSYSSPLRHRPGLAPPRSGVIRASLRLDRHPAGTGGRGQRPRPRAARPDLADSGRPPGGDPDRGHAPAGRRGDLRQ